MPIILFITFAVENIAKYIMENIVNLLVMTKWQMS